MKANKTNVTLKFLLGIFATFLISLTILIPFLVSSENANANDAGTTQTESIVSELTESNGDYIIITSEMTSEEAFNTLKNRNGKVVIEIIEGTVLDDEGNGEYSYADYTYYINYDAETFHKGDKVITVFVYNPDTNYTDDIISRYNVLAN